MLYTLFYQILNQYRHEHSRIVLAFSGGIDSRVMLHLLARFVGDTGCEAIAVHIHHGLSPHADSWGDLCRQWCEASGIPFHLRHVSVDINKQGSLESIARQARYAVLEHYVGAGDLLLTGQHSDDQLETFLLALKRGSGPRGLSAMGEISVFGKGQLVRPLLKVSRAEIESYARTYQLDWVEDESNQDKRYDRNFIRHEVAPVLMQRWPDLRAAVQRSCELCAEQETLLDELLAQQLNLALQPDKSLSVDVLLSFSEPVCRRVLRMWFSEQGMLMPTRTQLVTLYQQVILAKQDANPIMRLGPYDIRRFSGKIYCVPLMDDVSAWQHNISINEYLVLPDQLGTVILRECAHGILSQEKLSQYPLKIVFNPQGLSACPAGRCGRNKLKKLFQEYHVPVWQRCRMPILLAGEQVAAIASLFVDRDFIGTDCDFIWKSQGSE